MAGVSYVVNTDIYSFLGCPGELSNRHNSYRHGPFFFDLLICYVKSSTILNERNNWALPSGAQEQIGSKGRNFAKIRPKWRCRAPDGSAHLFRSFDIVDDFTEHIKKSKKKSARALTSYPYFTIFSARHSTELATINTDPATEPVTNPQLWKYRYQNQLIINIITIWWYHINNGIYCLSSYTIVFKYASCALIFDFGRLNFFFVFISASKFAHSGSKSLRSNSLRASDFSLAIFKIWLDESNFDGVF